MLQGQKTSSAVRLGILIALLVIGLAQDARLVIGRQIFPGFSGDPRSGSDLALLYLRHPVNHTLPILPISGAPLGEGQRLVGLGWGVTGLSHLHSIN